MTLQGFGRRGFGLASRWRVLSLSRDLFSAFNLLSNSFSLFWNEVDILDFDHVTKFVGSFVFQEASTSFLQKSFVGLPKNRTSCNYTNILTEIPIPKYLPKYIPF